MMLTLMAMMVCIFVGIANERAMVSGTDEALQKTILVFMVVITIFGGVMIDAASGYSTNAGSVFYAGVLALQYIIMRRFGWEAGLKCVVSTFVSLIMLVITMAVMAELSGSDELGRAYALVIETSRRVTVASFVAFASGQLVFVVIYKASQKMPTSVAYGANMVVVQAVDSAIFYPIAFGFDKMGLGSMLSGYAIKVGIGLLAIPLLSLATRRHAT